MKKLLIALYVALVLALSLGCLAEEADNSAWKLDYYVDEFRLPTDEPYVTNAEPIIGIFSNSATTDSELLVNILVNEKGLAIMLDEYGSSRVKNSYSSQQQYNVTLLDDARQKTNLSGYMPSGVDRILFDEPAAQTILNALRDNASLSFYIEEADRPSTNYLFAVTNTSGFAEALTEMYAGFHERDYQQAVELYNSGDYEAALALFAELGDYKDSAEWLPKYQAMKYAEAEALLTEGKYAEANDAFIAAGNYSDAAQRVGEPYYVQAEALLAEGDYKAANEAFIAAGDYSDAAQRVGEPYYVQAEALLAAGDPEGATAAFEAAGEYSDAKQRIWALSYEKAAALEEAGETARAAIAFGCAYNYKDAQKRSLKLWEQVAERKTIAAGGSCTIGLKSDGTVVATGYSQSTVQDWQDVIAVSLEDYQSVCLKSDGTVQTSNDSQSLDWTDIVSISARGDRIVGLKSDGTVVENFPGYQELNGGVVLLDSSKWTDIIAVAKGDNYTVCLKSDHTVVAYGRNNDGQCKVSGWKDIIAIAAGEAHTVGLKSDGTVVAIGDDWFDQCKVSDWNDIIAIAAGDEHTVGLKSDGTVVAVGSKFQDRCEVSDWTNIVAIAAGEKHTVGLKSDGTVVAVGDNTSGQCDVSEWNGIKVPANIPYPTLQRGDKGDAVKALQQRLIELGYLDGAADGDFGRKSEAAVQAFQQANGLDVTGVANDATQHALYSESAVAE